MNCYNCDQGGEVLQDCKRRNILYESNCVICNLEEERKKKKECAKELNGKKGVYVGESACSIFERVGEQQDDKYSHCKIPRLVIDQDDLRINKKMENAELEPKVVEVVIEINEEGEENTVVLQEEAEFGF